MLFYVAKTPDIASRLFWRPKKASPFRFGKIAFSAEKANSFRFGKIAFSGRQDARNCQGCCGTVKKLVLLDSESRLRAEKKTISIRFGKFGFSGR